MAKQQGSKPKGTPKRGSNQTRAALAAASWSKHKQDAATRDAAQDAAHRRNKAAGISPWQTAKIKRAAIRAADPDVQRRVANSRQARRERDLVEADDYRG